MTNEEREALIAQGWTPPVPVDPEVGSIWKHYNGGVYEVIAIANTLNTEKYPKAVIHKNRANGTVWTRRADDWHRSYTQQAKTSETPVDPDLAETEKIFRRLLHRDQRSYDAILKAIKRGRALAAAEAKPGMDWVKHDGSGKSPVDSEQGILVRFFSNEIGIRNPLFTGMWPNITHYAIITPPEDVA